MNIIIKTKNVELTEPLKKIIHVKVGKLEKFIKVLSKTPCDLFVEIERETTHHKKGNIFKAELMVAVLGKNLVAVFYGRDLREAVAGARNELEREINTYKMKDIELPRRKIRKAIQKENF